MKRSTTSLFRSKVAARLLVALSQRDGTSSLRVLARALQVRDSSVQRAVAVLRGAGLLRTVGGGHVADPRHPAPSEALVVALADLARDDALRALVRANDGVEYATFVDPVLRIVYRNAADAASQLRLERTVALLDPVVDLESHVHDGLVAALREEPGLRERMIVGEILKGTVERSLPDPERHGDFAHARVLGAPHRTLAVPSQRALRRVARRYELAHLGLFGSAVRDDFRPDSDVDVLIRFRARARAGFGTLTALRDELEDLFDRDVDVVEAGALSARMLPNVAREEVVLVGRP